MTRPAAVATPPAGIPAVDPTTQVWFTTDEAAAYTRRHRDTVLRAAAAGPDVLRSSQTGRKGHRRYRREWLDAWADQP